MGCLCYMARSRLLGLISTINSLIQHGFLTIYGSFHLLGFLIELNSLFFHGCLMTHDSFTFSWVSLSTLNSILPPGFLIELNSLLDFGFLGS